MKRARVVINVEEYRILYDDPQQPASNASCVMQNGTLWMTMQLATDGDLGVVMRLTKSHDMGRTWSVPRLFGPPLGDENSEFQSAQLMALPDGKLLAIGCHRPQNLQQVDTKNQDGQNDSGDADLEWRPCDLLVGHQQDNGEDFSWTRYPSGTFLGEQFAYPGLCTRDGRVIFCVWGAKNRGENWRCGVLISDDKGHNPRYQDVAYADDMAIRHDPDMPAGFNEQTLFETRDGALVSLIRGRDKLGAIEGSSSHSSEALFARCESQDGGQTWAEPVFTNLPGTGAAYFGPTLPDGSLLLASRLPTTWSRHDDHDLYGLLLARSFDEGLSWETELIFRRDPEGVFFDDYYNAMNGQWIMLDENRAMYVFGYFQHRQNRHRVIALQLSWK